MNPVLLSVEGTLARQIEREVKAVRIRGILKTNRTGGIELPKSLYSR
jgi:hypothetical protein